MVAGGSHDNSLYLDSTEIFNWEWPNNAKWVNAKRLPAPRSDFSAATLDNVVFAFGKYGEIYPQAVLSLVQLLHYCALIGREIHIVMLRQLLYALKTQRKARNTPSGGAFGVLSCVFMA